MITCSIDFSAQMRRAELRSIFGHVYINISEQNEMKRGISTAKLKLHHFISE